MQLTPYGVLLALMTKVVAGSNLQDIIKLSGSFCGSVISWSGDNVCIPICILLGVNGISSAEIFPQGVAGADICLGSGRSSAAHST